MLSVRAARSRVYQRRVKKTIRHNGEKWTRRGENIKICYGNPRDRSSETRNARAQKYKFP